MADINSGLVGWWKCDEGSGLSAFDSSGNGLTLASAAPTWVAGKLGPWAVDFTGAQVRVTATGFTNIPGYPFSLSAWTKANTGNNGSFRSALLIGLSGTEWFGVGWSGTTGVPIMGGRNTTFTAVTSTTIGIGIWTHLVGVYTSATDRKLYVNGKLAASDAVSIANLATINRVSLGDDQFSGGVFLGSVDDARVYNRVLSASDAMELSNYPTEGLSMPLRPRLLAPGLAR